MLEENQLDVILANPMYGLIIAAFGLIFVFLVIKYAVGKKPAKVSQTQLELPSKSKRKRIRKQQEKKNSISFKVKKAVQKSEVSRLEEVKKPIYEEKIDKKKDGGKSKSKSKKKKNFTQPKIEIISETFMKEDNFDDGDWKTVLTKAQRIQIKRQKRKLEEALTIDSTLQKVGPTPLVQAPYKPVHNPAIAKGIAPRFARAAGAEWQEKPTFPVVNQPLLQPKRPMPPATVPGTTKPNTKNSTVTQQTWSQGAPAWQESLGWGAPSTTIPTTMMSFHPNETANLLSMSQPSDKKSPDGWPPGGATWQSGHQNSNPSWEVKADDWVHVKDGNGSNNKGETWQSSEVKSKDDFWTFEPEGFSLPQQQVENSDPWGMEAPVTEMGDWSAPLSSWDNANAGWTAPCPVKPQPTYIDDSSDEEVAPVKVNPEPTRSEIQPVVGNSQEATKKSRRRRKKKQNTEQLPLADEKPPKAETDEIKTEATAEPQEAPKIEEASEDWSVPKVTKKRARARKAD